MSEGAGRLWPQRLEVVGVTGEYASGKAQPLSAKILTPNGWTTMGQLRVGQSIVDPSTGGECNVIRIFPQGKKPVFKIAFSDGATTECCDDHLWPVRDWNRRFRNQDYVTKTTRQIREASFSRFYLPLVEPVKFTDPQSLTPDPYLLGTLLGDGGLTHATNLTTADQQILEEVCARLPESVYAVQSKDSVYDYRLVAGPRGTRQNPLRNKLRELDVFGKRSYEKTIPHEYATATIWDRLSLLQGICDTDGSAIPGACDYSTTSAVLARQVRELAWSLGGTATQAPPRCTTYVHNSEQRIGRPSHRLYIRLPEGMCPFKLAAKAEIYSQETATDISRRIVSIEPVGEKECQCILVDSPTHLYVTDDYVVTHNTVFALSILPTETLYYDTEKSGGTYEETLRIKKRIDIPSEMLKQHPNSEYKPIDTFNWWRTHVRSIKPGDYRVIVLDVVSEIETGLVEWVSKNPHHFGRTTVQYQKMAGLLWGDVKELWKAILMDLTSRCETFVFVSHMANVWSGDRPSGKRKPKGKETLMELASLYLELDRKPRPDGTIPIKPAAKVLKTRLVTPTADGDIVPTLPPRLPECTPKRIREYMLKPPDQENLKPEEKAPEEKMSDDDRLQLQVEKAERESQTALANLAYAETIKNMSAPQKAQMTQISEQTAVQTTAAHEPTSSPAPAPASNGEPINEDQYKKLVELHKTLLDRGLSEDYWKQMVRSRGSEKARGLSSAKANDLIAAIEKRLNDMDMEMSLGGELVPSKSN